MQRGLAFDADRLIVRSSVARPRECRGQFSPPTDAATELNRRLKLRRCATRRYALQPCLDLAIAAFDDIGFVCQPCPFGLGSVAGRDADQREEAVGKVQNSLGSSSSRAIVPRDRHRP